ncbi:hypothetical protein VNO78_18181 [Psophocarpus tetragonolobus]|uniref:Uncharacterized protein n=1 Tax=Psophocarpus tetragonolobus TaxID=3891 RepID=A0AAN9XL90_PSOTE
MKMRVNLSQFQPGVIWRDQYKGCSRIKPHRPQHGQGVKEGSSGNQVPRLGRACSVVSSDLFGGFNFMGQQNRWSKGELDYTIAKMVEGVGNLVDGDREVGRPQGIGIKNSVKGRPGCGHILPNQDDRNIEIHPKVGGSVDGPLHKVINFGSLEVEVSRNSMQSKELDVREEESQIHVIKTMPLGVLEEALQNNEINGSKGALERQYLRLQKSGDSVIRGKVGVMNENNEGLEPIVTNSLAQDYMGLSAERNGINILLEEIEGGKGMKFVLFFGWVICFGKGKHSLC